ncbi:hypothetical protein [Nocardiopsis sp. HUAS JQ3]|uniref:hypothetical protein n=1 Tax=Nocardiopsis sp. HUAS JQ3 TaxID=3061629 RepID=UPI0023A9A7E9|nr:hypothetical protein [Nocardiopsis sp. HUAS JQ3]WDZ92955.1 hypothetical protein PV789_10675 [Nocardiopsis sp. HUAS JQ3]
MRRVDHRDLEFPEGGRTALLGQPFTGQATTRGTTETSAQTFIEDIESGPELAWHNDGQLLSLDRTSPGGMPVGPLHRWDKGRLTYEHINDPFANQRVTRNRDTSGHLITEERHQRLFASHDPHTGRKVFLAWHQLRVSATMHHPAHQEFLVVPDVDELTAEDVEGLGRRVLFQGTPYTGEAVTHGRLDRVRMHTFVEGVEDGLALTWASTGKLIAQGPTQHPHGPIGPRHQWDEQGRLLRETIHDALGNRVIVRELDETGNIAREERRAPTRLVRDPETGEERPAS